MSNVMILKTCTKGSFFLSDDWEFRSFVGIYSLFEWIKVRQTRIN
jgi:hypothetical protein